MSTLFRNASTHAVTLASGRTLAPGEDADIDDKSRLDQAMVDAGDLIPVDDPPDDDFAQWVRDSNVADVLERVADDPELRERALAAEGAATKPRKTLIDQLSDTDQEATS